MRGRRGATRRDLRPLSDRFPEPFDAESQIWLRRDASSPWEVDLPITPDRDGLWTSKRWSSHVAPVDDVTWVADDGIRYLRPEITLHFKARFQRPKDERDLEVALPLLTEDRRAWLTRRSRPPRGRTTRGCLAWGRVVTGRLRRGFASPRSGGLRPGMTARVI